MKKAALGVLALMVLVASPAFAGSATANVSVSANIANVCTISTSAVAFGAYDPIVTNASTALDASGAVTITCTKGASTTVGLGLGANAAGSVRKMKDSGSNLLTYELYQLSYVGLGLRGTGILRKGDVAVNGNARRTAQSNRTETIFEQPGSSIVTPYITSAVSIVRLLCVMAMNWVSSVISRRSRVNRSMFASSSGASTSSRMQKGEGL